MKCSNSNSSTMYGAVTDSNLMLMSGEEALLEEDLIYMSTSPASAERHASHDRIHLQKEEMEAITAEPPTVVSADGELSTPPTSGDELPSEDDNELPIQESIEEMEELTAEPPTAASACREPDEEVVSEKMQSNIKKSLWKRFRHSLGLRKPKRWKKKVVSKESLLSVAEELESLDKNDEVKEVAAEPPTVASAAIEAPAAPPLADELPREDNELQTEENNEETEMTAQPQTTASACIELNEEATQSLWRRFRHSLSLRKPKTGKKKMMMMGKKKETATAPPPLSSAAIELLSPPLADELLSRDVTMSNFGVSSIFIEIITVLQFSRISIVWKHFIEIIF